MKVIIKPSDGKKDGREREGRGKGGREVEIEGDRRGGRRGGGER